MDSSPGQVADGIQRALEQAKEAAGDKDVSAAGGANVVQQCLRAGLLDEMQIHLVPILLGDGIRLFDANRAGNNQGHSFPWSDASSLLRVAG